MDNRSFHNLLNKAEEQMRIWDLRRLYGYMLNHKATIAEVNEVLPNVYEVKLVIQKFEELSLFPGGTAEPVISYETRVLTLKPPCA